MMAKTMRTLRVLGLATLLAAGWFVVPQSSTAQVAAPTAAPAPRLLTVTGEGDVRAVPDQAQLSAGVVSDGKTAAAALAANSRAMNAVFAALRQLGVPDRAIRTSDLGLSPRYSDNPRDTDSARHIVGYEVSNQVNVTLDDVSKVGPVLDALAGSGANQAGGVSFSIRDPKPLLAQAREQAVKDATARAQTYAKAAGVTLGNIVNIQEGGDIEPPRPMMRMMAANALAAPTPVAAGEQTVSAAVTISWAIQ